MGKLAVASFFAFCAGVAASESNNAPSYASAGILLFFALAMLGVYLKDRSDANWAEWRRNNHRQERDELYRAARQVIEGLVTSGGAHESHVVRLAEACGLEDLVNESGTDLRRQ